MHDNTNPQSQEPTVVNSRGRKLILFGIPLFLLSLFLLFWTVTLGFLGFLWFAPRNLVQVE